MLFNKWGQAYLEQLLKYVADKKKRGIIQSEKKYLYGVLKKTPQIGNLVTPSCVQKLNQDKIIERVAQEAEQEKRFSSRRKEEEEMIARRVAGYFSELRPDEI